LIRLRQADLTFGPDPFVDVGIDSAPFLHFEMIVVARPTTPCRIPVTWHGFPNERLGDILVNYLRMQGTVNGGSAAADFKVEAGAKLSAQGLLSNRSPQSTAPAPT
jgi:hypothetical protein